MAPTYKLILPKSNPEVPVMGGEMGHAGYQSAGKLQVGLATPLQYAKLL